MGTSLLAVSEGWAQVPLLARFPMGLPAESGQDRCTTEVLTLGTNSKGCPSAWADTSSISPRAVLGASIRGFGDKGSSLSSESH